jgi:hypothetical protein
LESGGPEPKDLNLKSSRSLAPCAFAVNFTAKTQGRKEKRDSYMFIFDAHLDLAMNAMEWNRDLRLPVEEIRAREKGMTDKPDRGKGTVSIPELRKGNIGLVVATQIARVVEPGSLLPGWYSAEQAWAQTQGQLAWYRAMETAGEMIQIRNSQELEAHLRNWNDQNIQNNRLVISSAWKALIPLLQSIIFILRMRMDCGPLVPRITARAGMPTAQMPQAA